LQFRGAAREEGEGARVQGVVQAEGDHRDEEPQQHGQGTQAAHDQRERLALPGPQRGAQEQEDQAHQAAEGVQHADDRADELADVLAVGPLPQPPLEGQLQADEGLLRDRAVGDALRLRGRRVLAAQDSNHDRLPSARSPPPTRSMKVCTRLPPRRTSSSVPSASSSPSAMIATWLHSPSTSSITWLESTTVPPPST